MLSCKDIGNYLLSNVLTNENIEHISEYIPSIWIGRNVAAYIRNEPLELKIAVVAHSIFIGLSCFAYFSYISPAVAISRIIVFSVATSLLAYCMFVISSGYSCRQHIQATPRPNIQA